MWFLLVVVLAVSVAILLIRPRNDYKTGFDDGYRRGYYQRGLNPTAHAGDCTCHACFSRRLQEMERQFEARARLEEAPEE